MNVLHNLILCASLLFLCGYGEADAQKGIPDTTRRGPIFQLIGGTDRDQGIVKPQKRTEEFYVTNPGDDTLRILRTSCPSSDMLAGVDSPAIPPGDTVRITVLEAFGHRLGVFNKTCIISTNDRANETVVVHLHGELMFDLTAEPDAPYLRLDSLKPGETRVIPVVLRASENWPVTFYPAAHTFLPGYTITTDPADTVRLYPGDEQQVLIRVTSSQDTTKPTGSIGIVSFNRNEEEGRTITYEVHAD